MSPRRWLAAWLVLLQGFAVVTPAVQPAVAQPDPAVALVELALEARRRGEDGLARELLLRALTSVPDARTFALLGLSEQALGDWASADARLRLALARPHPWTTPRREVLERALAEGVGRVTRLVLEPLPEGAVVRVDGVPVVPVGGAISLTPTEHAVSVELDGHVPMTFREVFPAGTITRVIALARIESASESAVTTTTAPEVTEPPPVAQPEAAVVEASVPTAEPAAEREPVENALGPPTFQGGELRLFGGFELFTDTSTGLFRRAGADTLPGASGGGGGLGLELGARPIWFLALGLRVSAGWMSTANWPDAAQGAEQEGASPGTLMLGTASAYLRVHTAEVLHEHQVDVFFGGGFGVAGSLVLLDASRGDSTLWSFVVPIDVGLTYHPVPNFGLTLLGAVEPWIPQEYCGEDPLGGERYCLGAEALDLELRVRVEVGFTLLF